MENKHVYYSNGFYLGFIMNDYLYSRDGEYLGWIEGSIVWDSQGKFRGVVFEKDNRNYILRNRFSLLPLPRTPKQVPVQVTPPAPPKNTSPIQLPVELIDGY